MNRYTTKKAVVLGGTGGLGLAMAKLLAEEGAEVLVTGRSEANLAAARSTLGKTSHVVRSDMASLTDIRALASTVAQQHGAIDALFVNAGYCKLSGFAEVSESEYDHTFAINTKGAYFSVQQLAPLMREGGGIVFTTSIANRTGYPGMSVYAAAKAALRSLAQGFAVELLERRIRVNALSPGFIRTDTMGLDGVTREQLQAFVREGELLTPMRRIAAAEEVARAALFLAFDATFTTGEELLIDGGMMATTLPHDAA